MFLSIFILSNKVFQIITQCFYIGLIHINIRESKAQGAQAEGSRKRTAGRQQA